MTHSRFGASLLAVLVLIVGQSADDEVEAANPTDPCVGRWVGEGTNDGSDPWTIEMVVTQVDGTNCGSIEYPSLDCGGSLITCRRDGDVVTFQEKYTHNAGCLPAGTIKAVCTQTSMTWAWLGQSDAHTVLRRVDSP